MGTLSSFSFSVTPPNACSFVGKLQKRTKCFLCGEFSSKRRRGLVAQGDFPRLNFVIRSCYKGEDNRNGDSSSSSGGGSSTGEREGKEKSNLATMTPAEKKSDDNGDDSPASMSSRFKSILPDRKAKVDISLAGPFAGAALSFSMFLVGLLLSSNPSVAEDLVKVPSTLFQGSLLLGLISRAVLGYTELSEKTHQLRLLGGPLSLPWGLYVLICQRAPEKPCLNDVTEVGTWRKAVFAMAITLVVMTLLPVWDELAEELGIGLVTSL
ncbi:UNVERIFIED_CONTAM: putative zinc metalloprotease EGY1, chloroplastic [Sesamum angustifolium]|uniref:Zinc metalloprotease EGY1, chloroplastic n=1 Tax=Sesamum angustifolium TaxID=2727405 RepID=A0AAW2PW75_9LAMI